MNLKCIALSEKSQTQTATYGMIQFIWLLEKAKLWGQKIDKELPGFKNGGKGFPTKAQQEGILGVMKLFYILTVVVATWLYMFVKTYWTVH